MANVLQWNQTTNSFSVSGSSTVTPVVGEGIDNNFSVTQSFQDGIAVTGSSTLDGTSSGSIVSSQEQRGITKEITFLVNGYVNDTTTNQSITFPVAFTQQVAVTFNNTGLTITASLTGLTITAPDSTTAYNGVIVVKGG